MRGVLKTAGLKWFKNDYGNSVKTSSRWLLFHGRDCLQLWVTRACLAAMAKRLLKIILPENRGKEAQELLRSQEALSFLQEESADGDLCSSHKK